MAQKDISIYITSEETKIAEIIKSGSNLVVSQAYTVPTPPGCVEDGMIRDVTKMADFIYKELIQRNRNLAKDKPSLYFSVFSRKIASKEINLPYLKKEKLLGEMIDANIDEYFPMGNLEDYITRFSVLETYELEGAKNCRIVVYAVLKELVVSYMELAKAIKLPLGSIDYTINSLYRLTQKQNRASTSLILQMDDDATHISIMKGGFQLFRRTVPYGTTTLIQSLAASKNLSEKEARDILFSQARLAAFLSEDEYGDLLGDFSAAIMRVTDFFASKNQEVTIEKAKIIGSGCRIARINEMLGRVIGLEIITITELRGVSIRKLKRPSGVNESLFPTLSFAELSTYLPNIGAMIAPLDLRIEEEAVIQKTGVGYGLFIFLLVLSILVAGGASAFFLYQQSQLESERDSIRQAINAMRPAEGIYNSYLGAIEYHDMIVDFTETTGTDAEALLALILSVEQIAPAGIGINSLQVTGRDVRLTMGATQGKDSIARFIQELHKIPFISGIWVDSIRDSYDDEGYLTNSEFPIRFSISYYDGMLLDIEGGQSE